MAIEAKPKVISLFPEGESIVSMVHHDGHLYVATNKEVYVIGGREKDKLTRVKLNLSK
jgi:hypothetical protein